MRILYILCLIMMSCQGYALEHLFPNERPGKTHLIEGLNLIQAFYPLRSSLEETTYPHVECRTKAKENYRPEGTILPPDFHEDPAKYTTYGENNLSLCIGRGGSKIVVKISPDSEKVLLLNMHDDHLKREYYDYIIINAFGLISQQDPALVTVKFDEGTKRNAISVLNFDYIAQNTSIRTWDVAKKVGYGETAIFNSQENFNDIDYNLRLIAPFIKDIALWYFIGTPGGPSDSPNLIFKRVGGQTLCRLFLYDINSKSINRDSPLLFKFGQFNPIEEHKESVLKFIKYHYGEVCRAVTLKEQSDLEITTGSFTHVQNMFNTQLQEALWDIFEEEYTRLNALLEEKEVCEALVRVGY